ncbi:MFS transporter [Streptomyces sp. WMMC897]|uniref:MFS transporter n=1 Tax=Streptomyces sp. WMMC897 TaxID=3014782 RepID=UPI0022B70059|nr:MFS transporter [Streptomyces sp. WMMC897]MCZ7416013.1 MFS transporter [Streptomyces sp. WMMC897]
MSGRRNPWAALGALCLGFFMIMVDTTIVNIAVPVLMDDLDAGLGDVLWVVNAYVLVYAALLVASGRLGDLLGQKRVYLVGLLLFTAASAWCGLSDDVASLVAARSVQGLGAALLTPQTTAFIALLFPRERRGAAYGMWSGVAGLATITGPLLGGFVVTRYGWEWLFFINVPIGLTCMCLVIALVPGQRAGRRTGLDLPGTALVSAGLFALAFGLLEGERYDWGTISGPLSIPAVLALAVVLLLAFAWQQRRSRHPLIPGALLAHRDFVWSNAVVALVTFAMAGSLLLLMLYLQTALDLSPLRAGLTTAPLSAAFGVVGVLVGRRSTIANSKTLLLAGLGVYATGLAATAYTADPGTSPWLLLLPMLVCGVGLGFVFSPMSNLALGQLDRSLAGAASGVYNTTRQVGNVLGSAVFGVLLQMLYAERVVDHGRERVGELPPEVQRTFTETVDDMATAGLEELGSGPDGAGTGGLPDGTARAFERLVDDVFTQGLGEGLRLAMLGTVAVVLLAMLSCRGLRRRGAPSKEDISPVAQPRESDGVGRAR